MHPEKVVGLQAVSVLLPNAQSARQIAPEHHSSLKENQFLDEPAEEVVAQLGNLETHPTMASSRRGDLELYWMYKIHAGEIWNYDGEQERFVLLDSPLIPAKRPARRRAAT